MSNQKNRMIRNQGFTLVELSIVIIIIGFLIAGVAAATSLVKQAEINSVVTDLQGYQTAYNNFMLRYNAVPGDMKTASTYWTDGVCGETATNCDGDGNALINFDTAVPDETASALKELSLAGMISSYIQVIPDAWDGVENVGSTIPASKVTGAGFILAGASVNFGVVSPWTDGITNSVFIGKPSATGLGAPALKPEDAFNMDKKIDDGSVSGGVFGGANTGNFRSKTATTGTCTANAGAEYDLTVATAGCVSGLALN